MWGDLQLRGRGGQGRGGRLVKVVESWHSIIPSPFFITKEEKPPAAILHRVQCSAVQCIAVQLLFFLFVRSRVRTIFPPRPLKQHREYAWVLFVLCTQPCFSFLASGYLLVGGPFSYQPTTEIPSGEGWEIRVSHASHAPEEDRRLRLLPHPTTSLPLPFPPSICMVGMGILFSVTCQQAWVFSNDDQMRWRFATECSVNCAAVLCWHSELP
ncbi:hypothetical protein QBC43DRAFT_53562 [Cladorrhinum sp. PSN259]|nr:hypothetical protein QBC43DRAFT_53562 [Cladorrhinum sp. PSN259]